MNTHLGMCQIFARGPGRGDVAAIGCALLHGLHWDTEVGKDAITRTIEVAKPAGARAAFDVADPFAVERYRADFLALIREHVEPVLCMLAEVDVRACIAYAWHIVSHEPVEPLVVEVPELPGCMADGASYGEAVTNAKVVIQEWIETARHLQRPD